MTAETSVFVDSNVFLYKLYANDPRKQAAADKWIAAIWDGHAGRISWQVIHEFYYNAVRKLHIPVATAREFAEQLLELRPEAVYFDTVQRAWGWCDHAQLSYWDGLIVAAAEQAGCRWLLSEDFQSGRRYGTVTVVNPFEHDAAEFGFS